MMPTLPPVVTIDGPSASGKGTIAHLLAKKLHWHFLDSGILYRAVGLAALQESVHPEKLSEITALIHHIKIDMEFADISDDPKIFLNNHEVTEEIRGEACGKMASQVSTVPLVRAALLDRQRNMRELPGLVTDGRDMGTVVFPDASVKFFFQASVEVRAQRRYNQLISRSQNANLRDVLHELRVRDERDANRMISPTKPAADAIILDTSNMTIEEVLKEVYQQVQAKLGV
ncbi:MAG: cytidylate kinase [Gammaproteobacteria bacterium RIFCSPHIGHO2_12_FULL_42_13]|nr:MAG: cytidylate kinase [Gammaproteobacteria bacterium RIFCSPHIGHO2_12_FULL_42_13]